MIRPILILLTSLLLTHCTSLGQNATSPQTAQSAAEQGGTSQDYILGPEDVVEVLVWKNDDLSRVVTVRPDGKISLPLIGDVQAAGLSTTRLAERITEKLLTYYKERPQVSVIVQQFNSHAFYILGQVNKPGKYVMKTGTTFLQGITLAGGLAEFASKHKILLLRRDRNSGQEEKILINYRDVLSGEQPNLVLRPGDTIVVP
jgi:polysaccharide export outer membrane protein